MEIHFVNVCVHVSFAVCKLNMISLGVSTNKALIGTLGFTIQTLQKLRKFYSSICLHVLEMFSFPCTVIAPNPFIWRNISYVSLCFSYMEIIGGREFCKKIKQDLAGYNQRTYQRYHWTGK